MSDTLVERIVDQYASSSGSRLYRHVMGDGSDHMHYGLYLDNGTQMRDALIASCQRLFDMATTHIKQKEIHKILDLGAGAGGPAKCLLAWTGAHITCVDLSEESLQALEAWALTVALSGRLKTFRGSFQSLPEVWTQSFDLIWSQEALCHATNRLDVFREAKRALRSSGAFVFSDILLADNAPPPQVEAFTSVNAVTHLGTHAEYLKDLQLAGFTQIQTEDWTPHLPMNFKMMLAQIRRLRSTLLMEGVSLEKVDRFASAIEGRLQWQNGKVLQWRAYLCGAK